MSTEKLVEFKDVVAAAARLRGRVHHTPMMTSRSIDALFPASTTLHFKCENLQKTGSFKPRGSLNAVEVIAAEAEAAADPASTSASTSTSTSTAGTKLRPVASHSSGNHGQGLSFAASVTGRVCHVAVPRAAPRCKRAAMEEYGAHIVDCGNTLAEREKALAEIIERTGALEIPPFNHPAIVAGQGTVALEMLEDVPGMDVMFIAVGGGGLISGCGVAARGATGGRCTVIGVEPELADDAKASLDAGEIQPQREPRTIADGLLTSLGSVTFPHIRNKDLVSDIILVSEQEIADAMKLIMERMKLVVEPSGAVALAGAIKCREQLAGKSVGILICGGNLDLNRNAAAAFWEA
eukprot:TRINITY_DN175_c0_g4_i1.p1 TRINITY_DN175_c0_g4~~TRINITY_DN175_c0_g4_i1.p1  ORF type:complete len:382 (+),score=191.89 TRINITY_DN175_c0_g4_i1:95-1147(+)